MRSTERFSKPLVAILSCVALLCSLLAVSLAVFADTPDSGYQPTRVMTVSVDDTVADPEINGKFALFGDNAMFTKNDTYTVNGYWKAENIKGVAGKDPSININSLSVGKTDSNGWVPFETTFVGGSWVYMEMWGMTGTFSLADVTISDDSGAVVYDLAEDASLTDGVHTNGNQGDIWWFGYSGTGNGRSYAILTLAKGHQPTRMMTAAVDGTATDPEINGKFALFGDKGIFTSGDTYTVSGYWKAEDIANVKDNTHAIKINNIDVGIGNSYGWVPFETTFAGGNWVYMEMWGVTGSLSLADVTITDEDGAVVYDLTKDTSLTDGVRTNGNQGDIWWFGFSGSGNGVSYDIASYTPAPTTTGDSQATTKPTVAPPTLPADDTPLGQADPNRVMAIVSESNANPLIGMTLMSYDFGEGGPFFLVGKIKVEDFAAQTAGGDAKFYIEFMDADGSVEKVAYTADTNGWIDLKGADGHYITFDNITDTMKIYFGGLEAKGTFSIGDLKIVSKANEIVYSLANDESLYGKGDMRQVSGTALYVGWKATEDEGSTTDSRFPVYTKEETYVPNKVLALEIPEDSQTVNAFWGFKRNNAVFKDKEGPFTITGKIKTDLTGFVPDKGNEPQYFAAITGDSDVRYGGSTGSWASILNDDGTPYTFTATEQDAYLSFRTWYSTGRVYLADIVITDKNGEVVYNLADDAAIAKSKKVPAFGGGDFWVPASFGAADSKLQFSTIVREHPVAHTAADYEMPVFEETSGLTAEDIANALNPDSGSTAPVATTMAVAATTTTATTAAGGQHGGSTDDESAKTGETTGAMAVAGLAVIGAAALLLGTKRRR